MPARTRYLTLRCWFLSLAGVTAPHNLDGWSDSATFDRWLLRIVPDRTVHRSLAIRTRARAPCFACVYLHHYLFICDLVCMFSLFFRSRIIETRERRDSKCSEGARAFSRVLSYSYVDPVVLVCVSLFLVLHPRTGEEQECGKSRSLFETDAATIRNHVPIDSTKREPGERRAGKATGGYGMNEGLL